jgi:hypothetical protein
MSPSEEARQKLLKALEAGRVEWAERGKRYFERAGVIKGGTEADWTIVEVTANFWGSWEKPVGVVTGETMGNKGGMTVGWSTVSAGFGELTIYIDKDDGKLKADTEGMGKDFCKKVLCALVDSWSEI